MKNTETRKLRFSIYLDSRLEWRWRLVSANGKVIADSAEGYKRLSHCRKMVAIIKSSASSALCSRTQKAAAGLRE